MSIGTPEVVHEIRLKRGRPIGSKDVTSQNRRTQMSIGTPEVVHEIRLTFCLIGLSEGITFNL